MAGLQSTRGNAQPLRKVGLRIALLSALWIAAISTGSMGTPDTDFRLQMTHAWLTDGDEIGRGEPNPDSRQKIGNGVVGVNGKRYMFYDPGQSVLMLPGDWLGSKFQHVLRLRDAKGLRIWTVHALVFIPLNVALVLTCFWLMQLFGSGKKLAAMSSLIWLLGTTVLPYAQIDFQNNQVLLFAMLSLALILAAARRDWQHRLLLLSGAAAGMTLFIRTSAAIHVLTIGLFLLACLHNRKLSWRESVPQIAIWVAGIIPFVVAGRIYDFMRYGSVWVTGQSVWLANINSDPIFTGLPPLPASYPMVNPPYVGILGPLFSPAKSIFIYDPLLIPCLIVAFVAWRTLSRELRWFSILAIGNFALHLALTSKLDFWHGDWAWAARYHLSSVDLLLVGLLPLLVQRALTIRRGAFALRAVIFAAIGVQLLAVSMSTIAEIGPEVLQEPVMCKEEWTSRLEFRLGARVRNLYCLASGSAASYCPAAIAARSIEQHPECGAVAGELEQANRLAFFPFEIRHRIIAARPAVTLWLVFLTLALAWTAAWFYQAFRESRQSDERA